MSKLIKKATRESFGEALVEVARLNDNIVVLDADLAAATKTQIFKKAFPDRFFDCGISECNMIGVGAGLSTMGKIPFVASFAMFSAGRGFEQIRNSIAYPNLNVKIAGSHAGISVGEDGATHQCCEDIALMRSIPNMSILNPCDHYEMQEAVKYAATHKGPMYIRLGRLAIESVNNNDDYRFEFGKGVQLKDGKDITLIATGLPVKATLSAANLLKEDGIDARVINIHTIKPIDKDIILKATSETNQIFTIEEHNIIGGLGEAVCSVVCENHPTKVTRIGINDQFGQSGPAVELLKHYKLDADGIYSTIKNNL